MYESPVKLTEFSDINTIIKRACNEMRNQQEEDIYRAIQSYGVDVDKDELIKALNYDRDQYRQGYMDGIKEFAEKFIDYIDVGHLVSPSEICLSELHVKRMVENFVKEMDRRNGGVGC